MAFLSSFYETRKKLVKAMHYVARRITFERNTPRGRYTSLDDGV